VGVFATCADATIEPAGAIGATVQFVDGETVVHRIQLVQGQHYADGLDLTDTEDMLSDGVSRTSVGICEIEGDSYRVDRLRIPVPSHERVQSVVFRDLGTPASFVIFDAAFAFQEVPVCPFRGHGAQVSLAEIGGIIRLRDRARFEQSVRQVVSGIQACEGDLDEARGIGVMFGAVVAASMLELGAPRSLHRFQLDLARRVDRLMSATEIGQEVVEQVSALVQDVFPRRSSSGDLLIDQALMLIDRRFADDLTDAEVARALGISTSHFRYLFRQITQMPFSKYLMSVRLEKARQMLLQTGQAINEVAEDTGFASPAHFSRVFAARFGVAPSRLKSSRH